MKIDPLTLNQRVQGSSPCAPTNKINILAEIFRKRPRVWNMFQTMWTSGIDGPVS